MHGKINLQYKYKYNISVLFWLLIIKMSGKCKYYDNKIKDYEN